MLLRGGLVSPSFTSHQPAHQFSRPCPTLCDFYSFLGLFATHRFLFLGREWWDGSRSLAAAVAFALDDYLVGTGETIEGYWRGRL